MPALAADRAALLEELRRRTGARRPAPPDALAPTGIAAIDEVVGGGLPKGRLTEIVGRRSSGRTALALAALGAASRRGEAVALVDVDGVLDARGAEAAGIDLPRLLWVRAGDATRGLRAVDLIARAGGFGVVVLDLGERAPRAADAAWIRLGRAAERSHLALVVVAPRPAARTFAALTIETGGAAPSLTELPLPGTGGTAPSLRALPRLRAERTVRLQAPRVVRAVESCVAVVRSKLGAPGGTAQVRWRLR
jgi:RecA/RadA recombinase